jgi:hypothetical protein
VLEHVDARDRVEPFGDQRRAVAFFEMTDAKLEAGVIAERGARARGARLIRLDADDALRDVEEAAAHRADANAHLQHPLSDVRPKQVEDVCLIPVCFAHRFQIVRGEAMLGLCKPSIDHLLP